MPRVTIEALTRGVKTYIRNFRRHNEGNLPDENTLQETTQELESIGDSRPNKIESPSSKKPASV